MQSSKSKLALCGMKLSILCHLCESSQVHQKTLSCNSNADMFYLAAWPHWPTCIGENHVCTPVSEQKLVCYIVDIRLCLSTCTPMFIAALCIIARTWKQPRYPSADEWIRKLWYIYTMEYYSAVKKNTFVSVLLRWMKLEPIIQSEVSQKKKHQYSILTHIYGI